ncbi:TIGR01457 family HAD-type hydrolase [Bacillus alkalicellulosilyticus]|uniref:TIGR01457 family HAD-type hydrolase n=1 Tax=Alkalihalobacterium alkalicellulosilyticum TaxID=1912214 RepID=UPI00099703F4|nr:TIGR01457 family HAD-type hydrolase [Bacillus alkalicellulosilyticus]
MSQYKGFLIDLDGTVYKGKEKIDAAVTFVNGLYERGLPYLFVTNNSSKTPEQVSDLLTSMGIHSTPAHVFTTSQATARFIHESYSVQRVYMIGEVGLQKALLEKGFELVEDDAEAVVIGIDREITYEKLAKACLLIRAGASFFSTNSDIALPTERGFVPGNGALTSVISVSTGQKPIFIGKPEAIIIDQASSILGVPKENTLLIGDNYDTDITAGIRAGIDTLLVHTGVTTKEHLESIKQKPTYSIDSLVEWNL